MFTTAKRMQCLSSAIFTQVNDLCREATHEGIDVINLSIGSPDIPPAPHIIESLVTAVQKPNHYGYTLSKGTDDFRQAVSVWFNNRFGVTLEPEMEVLSLMGSQDGLAHLAQCFIDPGDVVLVPDPSYPIFTAGPLLAGATLHSMPLTEENSFLPDFAKIPEEVLRKTKYMVLNYPNNPVAAVANLAFYESAVKLARQYNFFICSDLAYSELAYDGYKPPSILQVPGAKNVAIEFHSLSKTYGMAGARTAFAVGNSFVLSQLAKLKSNIDYGIFLPVQIASVSALTSSQDYVEQTARMYQERRNILADGLTEAGWEVSKPKASMYIWAPVPTQDTSFEFTVRLLKNTGVAVIPGSAFGKNGEGYVRFALVQPKERLELAVERIKQYLNVILGGA